MLYGAIIFTDEIIRGLSELFRLNDHGNPRHLKSKMRLRTIYI